MKRLYKIEEGKMICGVCGGLAEYFDVDVSLVRLIFVAIALVSVIIPMTIFYAIAWIVIPGRTASASPPGGGVSAP